MQSSDRRDLAAADNVLLAKKTGLSVFFNRLLPVHART